MQIPFLHQNTQRNTRKLTQSVQWKDIVADEIDTFISSDKLKWIDIGQKYYNGEHDILKLPRTAIGDDGRLIPVKNISDNRMVHNFCRELCDQKTQYLLGKPYIIHAENSDYLAAFEKTISRNFIHVLRQLAKNAINHGISWLHLFYDEKAELNFYVFPANEMIPIWHDSNHSKLDAMIRIFDGVQYNGKTKSTVECAKLWCSQGTRDFKRIGGEWKAESPFRPILTRFATNLPPEGSSWPDLPFVCMKYNDEERPLVRSLKSLIDNYDRVVSDCANALEDQPNSILVLRNYDGQRLDEFRQNLAAYRAVKVSDDGGVDVLQAPVAHDAITAHTDRVRRDIYSFGRGVDTRNEQFSGNQSGIALRHQYAQLDMDCNTLELQLQATIEKLIPFVNFHISEHSTLETQDYDDKLNFVFNRDVLINEEAAIQMCKDSVGIISPKTIAENHPWVRDAEFELNNISTN